MPSASSSNVTLDVKPDIAQLASASTLPGSSSSAERSARQSQVSPDTHDGRMDVDGDRSMDGAPLHPVLPTREMGEDGIQVDTRWDDRSAGFSLLSSDNMRFYVPIYHLQSMR